MTTFNPAIHSSQTYSSHLQYAVKKMKEHCACAWEEYTSGGSLEKTIGAVIGSAAITLASPFFFLNYLLESRFLEKVDDPLQEKGKTPYRFNYERERQSSSLDDDLLDD